MTLIIKRPTQIWRCKEGVDDEVFCVVVGSNLETVFRFWLPDLSRGQVLDCGFWICGHKF